PDAGRHEHLVPLGAGGFAGRKADPVAPARVGHAISLLLRNAGGHHAPPGSGRSGFPGRSNSPAFAGRRNQGGGAHPRAIWAATSARTSAGHPRSWMSSATAAKQLATHSTP